MSDSSFEGCLTCCCTKPCSHAVQESTPACQVHSLEIDAERQKVEAASVEKFEKALVLAYKRFSLFGILYDHYFVTDGKWTIEFRGDEVSEAVVHIHGQNPGIYDIEKTFDSSEAVKNRMRRICGARAFSFCFRNCEHVARYIAEGRWFSTQSVAEGKLWSSCLSKLAGDHQLKLNVWPWELEPGCADSPPCPAKGGDEFLTYTGEDCRVSHRSDLFTVLVLGSARFGMSTRIIDAFFGRCVSRPPGAQTAPLKLQVTHGLAVIGGRARTAQLIEVVGVTQNYAENPLEVLKAHLREDVLHVDRVVVIIDALPLQDTMCAVLKALGFQKSLINFTFVHCGLPDAATDADQLLAELYVQLGAEVCVISTPHLRTCGQLCGSLEYLKRDERPSTVLAAKMGLPAPSPGMICLLVHGVEGDGPGTIGRQALAKLLDATFLPCDGHFLTRDWRLRLQSSDCQLQ